MEADTVRDDASLTRRQRFRERVWQGWRDKHSQPTYAIKESEARVGALNAKIDKSKRRVAKELARQKRIQAEIRQERSSVSPERAERRRLMGSGALLGIRSFFGALFDPLLNKLDEWLTIDNGRS